MKKETRFKFNGYLTQLAELNGITADDVAKNTLPRHQWHRRWKPKSRNLPASCKNQYYPSG
jgi:hypothetical protein